MAQTRTVVVVVASLLLDIQATCNVYFRDGSA